MSDIYQKIVQLRNNGEEGVLVTVVGKDGHGPAGVGTKMLVMPDGKRIGTVGGGALEYAAIKKCGQVMKDKKTLLKKYSLTPDNDIIDAENTGMLCGGSITMFYEYIGSSAWLYIFGAGHIGKSLLYHFKDLNYFSTLIDSREGMVETVEGANRVITASYETALSGMDIPRGSFFIIATHSHQMDYLVLRRIFESDWNPKYVGLIASKRKAPEMITRLKEDIGSSINLECLYTPMGLDIGGQSPDEIAISIIAEIQAVHFNKEGHKHIRAVDELNLPEPR